MTQFTQASLKLSEFEFSDAFLLPLPNGVLSADSGAEVELVETALTGLELALVSVGLLILPLV